MKHQIGFTLIELVVFIIITSLLASTILIALGLGIQRYPAVHQQIVANQTAKSCMEWVLGQRRLNGYSTFSCPSTTLPSYCTAPTGFNMSIDISCTTLGVDTNFQTVAVAVDGLASAVLTTTLAEY